MTVTTGQFLSEHSKLGISDDAALLLLLTTSILLVLLQELRMDQAQQGIRS